MRSLFLACALFSMACGDPMGESDASTDARAGDRDAGRARDAGRRIDTGPNDAGPLPIVDPLEGMADVEPVEDGFEFLEGPLWRPEEGVLLFTDIPRNTIHRLHADGSVDAFRNPSDNANGLAALPDGRLLAAEHGARRVSVTSNEGVVTEYVTRFEGDRFNSPNDIAVRSDGTIYFSDPTYGLTGEAELGFAGVFRATPGREVFEEWSNGRTDARPNGLALSPDERRLYVAYTDEALVRVFDVDEEDGHTSNMDVFADDTPNADGMAIDEHGNLFVSTARGIMVFAPDGSDWGTIDVDGTPSNCGFGGDDMQTLYITAGDTLYATHLTVRGR
jgi:sugar lactone lactonase YvrE